jgi:hypothetical protein
MATFSPPILNREFACIVPDDNSAVGAVISSYFNDPGTYFAVFSFPVVDHPYARNFEFNEDGYLSRMIGSDAAIFINNAIVKLQPKKVFLAGMTKNQKSYIRAHLPKAMIVEIDSLADVSEKLAFLNKQFEGTVECRPSEVSAGLVLAKYTKKRLHIYDKATSLPKRHINKRRGVIVVENTGESHDISAINFAISVDADVVLVAPVQKQQLHPLQKLIYEWKSGSTESFSRLKQTIVKRVKGIDFHQYEFATFFTRGLPYGLILNNVIPFSHVLINIDSGLFIFNNIAYEAIPSSIDSAVVFSPEALGDEETKDVIAILENNNYVVRPVIGDKATVKAFNNYGGHFPYDVMHICSHGGETNGFYVVEEFPDRTGKMHRVEYEEVLGFSPENDNFQGKGSDQVLVTSKAIFKRFDGFAWGSNEIHKMPSFIFEDMRKAMHQSRRDGIIRVRVKEPIYASCHIKCYDSLHQGEFRAVASHGCPIIFNNTCSSWYEIAACFIQAGTRAYIGTLWRVGNTTAKNASKSFYEELFVGGNMLLAFHKMLASITNNKYREIYLFWGLHFSTLRIPSQKSDQKLFDNLLASFVRWSNHYQATASPELKRNTIPVLKFISTEIKEKFAPKHLQDLADDVRDLVSGQLEDIPGSDSELRGVIDL